MGSAATQGDLWGQAPSDWTFFQEPKHNPLFEAMLNAANVGVGTRIFDAGCGGGVSVLAAQRGAQVSGLDAAEGLIEIARERVRRCRRQLSRSIPTMAVLRLPPTCSSTLLRCYSKCVSENSSSMTGSKVGKLADVTLS